MELLRDGAKRFGITISDEQDALFETYYRELVDWNNRFNLTAITSCEDVQIKHFLDSVTIAAELRDSGELSVIDVGTGGGMPGIPVKLVLPDIRLTLLEATAKKTRFLQHVTGLLQLKNVLVITGRAEDIGRKMTCREHYDVVVARAVAPLATLAELLLPLCRVGGRCIAPKKGNIGDELAAASPAITLLGGSVSEVKPVKVEGADDNRCLVIISKTAKTPLEYPRRPGVPARRPLG